LREAPQKPPAFPLWFQTRILWWGLNHAEAQMIWAELQVRAVDRERATELLRQAGHR
jgi:hypothetical protein